MDPIRSSRVIPVNLSSVLFSKTPPIVEITRSQLQQAVGKLRASLENNWEVACVASTEANMDQRDFHCPPRTFQEIWNKRMEDSLSIFNDLSDLVENTYTLHTEKIFSYSINEESAGIITMQNYEYGDTAGIKYLVTHPGTQGCGGALIERAVKQSNEWGYNGCLSLSPTGGEAVQAYSALGFKMLEEYRMILDPQTSSAWEKDKQGEWKLKNHLNQSYLEIFFPPLTPEQKMDISSEVNNFKERQEVFLNEFSLSEEEYADEISSAPELKDDYELQATTKHYKYTNHFINSELERSVKAFNNNLLRNKILQHQH